MFLACVKTNKYWNCSVNVIEICLICSVLFDLTLSPVRAGERVSDPGLILVTILRSGDSCRARLPKGAAIIGNLLLH